ncbi:hypothetical protein MPL3356_60614 [Mesorhizobium plurifarium]|uniref:Uncharacterized protein n=1 Tax=Mesorhizobium plurifarium TaxID=69974 RepID=A0A090EFJ0_MESPL|nr:hypothetical protein MPL3356_60614 [Mesorhizobium plurifarium]
MDNAHAKLKDLGDRIQAAMDRHGITMAEITVRRFRRRASDLFDRTARSHRDLARAIDEACISAREMSEGLLRIQRRRK